MAERYLIRGDSYTASRPLYTFTFADVGGGPMNLTGCEVRVTYKTSKTDPNLDPTDEAALIKHDLIINDLGDVTTSNGLVVVGYVEDGVVHEHLTKAESLALPINVPIFSDVELVTMDGETVSWVSDDVITVDDAYTNRS